MHIAGIQTSLKRKSPHTVFLYLFSLYFFNWGGKELQHSVGLNCFYICIQNHSVSLFLLSFLEYLHKEAHHQMFIFRLRFKDLQHYNYGNDLEKGGILEKESEVEAESCAGSLCLHIYLGRFRPFVFPIEFKGAQSRSRLHICALQP